MRLRSAVTLAVAPMVLSASPALAQGPRPPTRGVFRCAKKAERLRPTESFKLTRTDGGLIVATGRVTQGDESDHVPRSRLTRLGTPGPV